MAWQSPEGVDEYLKSTEFCDSDNEEIKNKARELIKYTSESKEVYLL